MVHTEGGLGPTFHNQPRSHAHLVSPQECRRKTNGRAHRDGPQRSAEASVSKALSRPLVAGYEPPLVEGGLPSPLLLPACPSAESVNWCSTADPAVLLILNSLSASHLPTQQALFSTTAHATNDGSRSRRAPRDQSVVVLQNLPPSATPADVSRVIDNAPKVQLPSIMSWDGSSPRAAMGSQPSSRFVAEIVQAYTPHNLRPMGRFLLRLVAPNHVDAMVKCLDGKVCGGHSINAVANWTSRGVASVFAGDNGLRACSSRFYQPKRDGSVMHFVREIARQHPGKTVVLRGLPPAMTPGLIERRLQKRYRLANTPSANGGAASMANRVKLRNVWTDTNVREPVESVIKLTSSREAVGGRDQARSDSSRSADSNQRTSSMFLVRFEDAGDAYRFYRRLNGRKWDLQPMSARWSGGVSQTQTQTGSAADEGTRAADEIEVLTRPDSDEETSSSPPLGREMRRSRDFEAKPARPGELVTPTREYVLDMDILY